MICYSLQGEDKYKSVNGNKMQLFSYVNIIIFAVSQTIEIHGLAKVGSSYKIFCRTPDVIRSVTVYKEGTQKASCLVLGENKTNICGPVNDRFTVWQNESISQTVTVIKNVDVIKDSGNWYCKYGNDIGSSQQLQIYGMSIYKFSVFLCI